MSNEANDILAIQRLLAQYCLFLDIEDMEGFGALWAPVGEMHAFRRVWTGPEEIVAHIAQADPGLHMAGMPDIVVDGDTATGRQNFLFVEAKGHALRLGYYDDAYRRLPEGWRFASRRIVFLAKPTPA